MAVQKVDIGSLSREVFGTVMRPFIDAFNIDDGGGIDCDLKVFGDEGSASFFWYDHSEDKVFIQRTTTDVSPGRLVYIQALGSAMAAGQTIQGLQLRSRATGTGTIAGGTDGAEIKAGLNSDSDTGTLATARAVIANIDAKKGTITIGTCLEAQVDLGAGGTITTLYGVRASLNNSGTVTNGYAFYVDSVAGYPWKYGLYIGESRATYPIFIDAHPSGATATDQIHVDVDDTFTNALYTYARGVYVNWTHVSGDLPGEINAIAADVAVTAGDVGSVFAISLYTGGMGTGTVSHVEALYIYMDDIGGSATVNFKIGVDINIDNGDGATVCAYIRCYNHGGTINAFAYFPGSGAEMDDLFWFAATTGCLSVDAGATGANSTHKIRVRIGASTYAYIALFADY